MPGNAKAALKLQINKSDRNDAVGIARIMQCGWYKEVRVKDLDSHAIKALLVSRALLVKIKRDIENQVRGLLKNLGLVIGQAKMNVFAVRAAELADARPELADAVEPLLKARMFAESLTPRPELENAIMRRARPYRGENPVPGKDVRGELDPTPGIRERPRPQADIGKDRAASRSSSSRPDPIPLYRRGTT
jgi:hypothetical protein